MEIKFHIKTSQNVLLCIVYYQFKQMQIILQGCLELSKLRQRFYNQTQSLSIICCGTLLIVSINELTATRISSTLTQYNHISFMHSQIFIFSPCTCLLYTSDAADEEDSVDLGGILHIPKKKITR
eukprot:TRINITY_DN4067_c0_g1_i2.p4 TRINITY_DN4067_c0_g1~~TRINITY_DN4067_c0_g1_i2.p4  ORF type:complete len:125 (+),score=1.92 TRINITY_DN4067_c0_g1_i2:441-815(+)